MSDQALISAFLANKSVTVCATGEATAKAPKPDTMRVTAFQGISEAEAVEALTDQLLGLFGKVYAAVIADTMSDPVWTVLGLSEEQFAALPKHAQEMLADSADGRKLREYEKACLDACKPCEGHTRATEVICKRVASRKLMLTLCRGFGETGVFFDNAFGQFVEAYELDMSDETTVGRWMRTNYAASIAVAFGVTLAKHLKAFDNA